MSTIEILRTSWIVVMIWIIGFWLVVSAPASAQESPPSSLAQDANFPRNPSPVEITAMLKEETLEQSFFRLSNINLFFSPGPAPSEGRMWLNDSQARALSEEQELRTLEIIVGNRRVLKLYEDLSEIPKAEAGPLLSEHTLRLLDEYKKTYARDDDIQGGTQFLRSDEEQARQRQGGSVTGVSMIINTPDPNEVTLSGLRYAVLSLVWLAGALDLQEVRATVDEVAGEGLRQRRRLYDDVIHHDLWRESILENYSLYNRVVLGTALLQLAETASMEGLPTGLLKKSIRQTTWQAVSTIHEREVPDSSQGEIAVEYYSGLTDQILDVLAATSSN